jgi:hypothetical protein
MRKIAREAVIFALLGLVFASIWFFIQESESFRRAEAGRAQSAVRAAAASDDPAYRILFKAQNAENETRTEAWRIFWETKNIAEFDRRLASLDLPQAVKADLRGAVAPCFITRINQAGGSVRPRGTDTKTPKGGIPRPQDKADDWVDVPDFIPDYCTKFQLPAGLTPVDSGNNLEFPDSMQWPEPRENLLKVVTHNLPPALFMGLIVGFPAGLGVWLFYRLVRFAIQG